MNGPAGQGATVSVHGAEVPLQDALWEGTRAFKAGRYADALARLEPCARHGSLDAARLVARMYYAGHAGDKDPCLYVYWLARCAEWGDPAARSRIKRLLREGGVPAALQDDPYIRHARR